MMARKKLIENVDQVDEASAAQDTLKPGSMPVDDPKSWTKTELLAQMIGQLASVDTASLTKLYDDMFQNFGHYGDGAGDNAEKNKGSIATGGAGSAAQALGISVKEDVDAMLAGQELSEEFKDKARTLFEAAVNARVATEVSRIEDETDEAADQLMEELATEMIDKLDSYLAYVTEEWMTENEVAVESSIRSELTEEFIQGLRTLFAEHFIDIPSEKVDVVEALSAKVDELQGMVNDLIAENRELGEHVEVIAREDAIAEATVGLAATQVEKVKTLAEGIEFANYDDFAKKLTVIRENYFPTGKKAAEKAPSQLNEATEEPQEADTTAGLTPQMKRYVDATKKYIADNA